MIELCVHPDGAVTGEIFLNKKVASVSYTAIENLPDDLRTKLAALHLIQPPESIDGIGQRVSETVFWVTDNAEPVSQMTISEAGVRDARMYRELLLTMVKAGVDIGRAVMQRHSDGLNNPNNITRRMT